MSPVAVILDGYVDEPACLGVPPYVSPYIRTVAGALAAHRYTVQYLTIDQLRSDPLRTVELNRANLLVMIAGITVPGKYLGGTPATLTEIQQVGHMVRGPKKLIGGPIGFGYAAGGGQKAIRQLISGFDALLTGEPAIALDNFLIGNAPAGALDYARTDPWSVAGSGIITQHPDYPFVMCELETARGCSHGLSGGCSFCTEPFYGRPEYRSIAGIAAEVAALHAHGHSTSGSAGSRIFSRTVREPASIPPPARNCSTSSSHRSGTLPRISKPCISTTRTRQPLPGTRNRAAKPCGRSSGITRPAMSRHSVWKPPILQSSRPTTSRHSRMRSSVRSG